MTTADVGSAAAEPRPQRSRLAIFSGVALATVAAVVGWAIYFDLHGLIGRTALVYGIVFAFVPVVPIAAALLWLDRVRPEPARLLALALLWGALGAAYVALQVNSWLARDVGDRYGVTARSAVFIAPWVEEAAKGLIVFVIVWWRRHDFNAIIAGVVYAGLAGLGFSFTENIVYYGQLFQHVEDFQGSQHVALQNVEHLFLWRGVAAPFVHPMFTAMTGVGVGLAVRHRHTGVRVVAPVAGYVCAVLLHMAYNAAASFAPGSALTAVYVCLLVPAFIVLVTAVIVVRRYEYRLVAARLRDYTAFGWLTSSSVSYLAEPSGRRAARRYARRLGKAEVAALREYQRAGIDLGVLRDRVVRGVAGAGEASRETELVQRLRLLGQRVVLPPTEDSARPVLTRASSSW